MLASSTYCSTLRCGAVRCSALKPRYLHCSVWQCVGKDASLASVAYELKYVEVRCSVWQLIGLADSDSWMVKVHWQDSFPKSRLKRNQWLPFKIPISTPMTLEFSSLILWGSGSRKLSKFYINNRDFEHDDSFWGCKWFLFVAWLVGTSVHCPYTKDLGPSRASMSRHTHRHILHCDKFMHTHTCTHLHSHPRSHTHRWRMRLSRQVDSMSQSRCASLFLRVESWALMNSDHSGYPEQAGKKKERRQILDFITVTYRGPWHSGPGKYGCRKEQVHLTYRNCV